VLALTMGDPAGVGGEIAGKAWRRGAPPFLLLGDPAWLRSATDAPVIEVDGPAAARPAFARGIPVLPLPLAAPAVPGQPDPANAGAVIASIERAVAMVQSGAAAAVVTLPIAKHVLYAAGFRHPGHTEFLAALTGAPTPVMMLANAFLRVVPVTVHVSLRSALEQLGTEAIVTQGRILAAALRERFGIAAPRLAVAGLNPHAGEAGSMGDEERRIVAPAIAALRGDGITVTGPHPPDTMFTAAARPGYDAALCMYHDQALIPLKTLDMENGVNVTLGLPIVRTSPDHGTAFDIAGRGIADPSSLLAALRMAEEMAA
jgi:4-hydroxythreonine-4-phosphate dehydrogenase